jgi:polyhydroxybutyrate depolymerase
LFVLGATGCSQQAATALPAKAPGKYKESVSVGGLTRQFNLRVPRSYDGSKALPLVVLLHGWTSNMNAVETYTGFGAKAEQEGFLLAAPQGLGERPGWNVGWIDLSFKAQDDIAFLSKMIDQIEKEVGVDRSRIFIAGHSNGAMLAHLAASRLGSRIAAVGAVAGSIGFPGRPNFAEKLIPAPEAPVSVMLVHGTADKMVAYANGAQALLANVGARESAKWWADKVGASGDPKKEVSGSMTTEIYSGGRDGAEVEVVSIEGGTHDWPSMATDLIWKFFVAHPKKG